MSKLILKSPYIKSGSNAVGYMKYIATRENVAIVTDNRPATKKQEQLIKSIIKDHPDMTELFEYSDYASSKTCADASAFITMALDLIWDAEAQSDVYMKYIATRPNVERIGTHGLFGDADFVDLEKAMDELKEYEGRVWTHIISLRRGDAVRLGYDNANAWRNLIQIKQSEIAEAMKIEPCDFHWYAAFHDEGGHPHVHIMAWAENPLRGYLNVDGIKTIRSKLTNAIFKAEMTALYEQKSASRDKLVEESRETILAFAESMMTGICDHPEVEKLMLELASSLENVTGKKQYGYLPKPIKGIVDEVVNQMERLPVVAECYGIWQEFQAQIQSYYTGSAYLHIPLSQQKEFRSIKNAVIQEAERIRLGEITFEDEQAVKLDEPKHLPSEPATYSAAKKSIEKAESLDELDSAIGKMKSLAENSSEYAQYILGKMYRDGTGVFPNAKEALRWFSLAADQDSPFAQYALGKLHLSDEPEVRNVSEGLRWLRIAFENGNHYAGYRLGKESLRGELVQKDIPIAVDYLTHTAESGNQFAQYMLGKLYLMGQEVEQDKELAQYWLSCSAEQGNPYAQFFLDRIDQFREPSVMLSATRLLRHMGQIFQNIVPPLPKGGGLQIDRKRLSKVNELRRAAGRTDSAYDYIMSL